MFIEYLEQLFTKKKVENVKNNQRECWLQLLREFQSAKHNTRAGNRNDTASFSYNPELWNSEFIAIAESIKQGASIKGKRLRVKTEVIKDMIQKVCLDIKNHGIKLLNIDRLKDIDAILMVGGFSNSEILVNSVKKIVSSEVSVVVPEEAELAVVKGAVLFGWNQDKIVSRRSKHTYGYGYSTKFVSGKHSEKRAYYARGKNGEKIKNCDYLFCKLVTVNQEVKVNETIDRIISPLNIDQTNVSLHIHVTNKDDVMYTDEEDVEEVGKVNYIFPNVEKGFDREIRIRFMFGGTEIKVKVIDEASQQTISESSFIYF